MSLFGPLTLGADVEMFPVATLPSVTRDVVPHDADDFVISRAYAREPSRVVDRAAHDLLREFEEPTRIVDAVIRYASQRGTEPQATLEGAFQMLVGLYRARFLVPAQTTARDDGRPRLEPGMVFLGLTLGSRVHELEDTEVFFARDPAGRAAAVKVVDGAVDRVRREARAMAQASSRTPEVYGVHEWHGRGVLVAEWIYGDSVSDAASALRGRRGVRTEEGLLRLACDVVTAFAEIHHAGVLHGDIHPRNVLIDRRSRARIIDFDLAVELSDGPMSSARGGVAFYLEPELASAYALGKTAFSSLAGEQYALGALVYSLWTGVHYLDFSLEQSAMLRQITEEPPVSFARRRVPEWSDLEAILRRALAKTPEMRFPTCDAFAGALAALLPEARRRDQAALRKITLARDPGKALTKAFFERCGVDGSSFRQGPDDAPFASVNNGAAGIAYAMYKLAVNRNDARLLATANVWAHKATVLAEQDEAFFADRTGINEKSVGKTSLFHSPSGIHVVRALVALATGELAEAASAVTQFVTASRVPCEFVDLTLGKAGLLVGCAELLDATCESGGDRAAILARGSELRDELRSLLEHNQLATSASLSNLGLAHGWAGLLFALLRWSQASGEAPETYRAKLDELAALHEPHGVGVRWPVCNRAVDRSPHLEGWCNGSAGHSLLWALAQEQLGVEEYGEYAERACLSALSSDITLGTLCCGLTGIGYACAAVHRVTGDAVWLARARFAARRACEDHSKWFYRDSLYKGAVGAVLLREELEVSRPATPLLER